MAIFTPGPTIGQISGRIGGSVYSHNRGGAYIRNGTIPVAVSTPDAIAAKNRLTTLSRNWSGLTDDQRQAWRTWAGTNPVTNRLGNKITLAGHMAYMQVNARLHVAGNTLLDVPPVAAAPDGLLTLSCAASLGGTSAVLTFTATPVGAAKKLWTRVAVVDDPGIRYVTNLYKLVDISAANQATGLDIWDDIENRFGSLALAMQLHIECSILDTATGLLSGPLATIAEVAA
jgi:hypothetical protein